MRTTGPVTNCDVSLYRTKVAAVTEDGRLALHDAASKELELQEVGVTSVTFNLEVDDMVCFSGQGALDTRIGDWAPERRRCRHGEVAAFRGAKVYCVRGTEVVAVDLNLAESVHRAVALGDLQRAYALACLGVTAAEWRALATAAIASTAYTLARRALVRVKDGRLVELLAELEERLERSAASPAAAAAAASDATAEVLAFRGQYQEAAKVWVRAGMAAKAIDMFVDLRQWEQAKVFAASSGAVDTRELVRRQAEWAEEVNDWRSAADMFVSAGQPLRAAAIICDNKGAGWQSRLIDVARGIGGGSTDEDKEVLAICGAAFSEAGEDAMAKEVYIKLGDVSRLMAMYINNKKWAEAVRLSEEHDGKFDRAILVPHAQWLCDCGRFDDAIAAFRKAGRPDRALAVIGELVHNAIIKATAPPTTLLSQARFKDAAYYYWLSAKENLKTITVPASQWGPDERAAAGRATAASAAADIYYAYALVHAFTTNPFTSAQPETVFHASRFLLNALGAFSEGLAGVSRVHTLYALGKQAKAIGAFKLARFAFDRLQLQRVPPGWVDQVELDMLALQAKPVRDAPELLPVCYRCGATNPLVNPFANSCFARSDVCTTCGHPFVRSFINFEVLPLVEFVPGRGVSDDEALDLVRSHGGAAKNGSGAKDKWREGKVDDADVSKADA
ncbi:unnamed protein product [Phaeothamnion confervicola]